ncbi:MAG: tetratricopeptide repeat protein [Myxococcales bacterium]|nr:tetratricopeptide repeat protein [Myxococcales bacterium]
MLRRVVLCCVLASGVVTSPGLVLAKGAPSAKQAEKDGQKAEKQQKWDEAKSAYEKALELDDNPGTRIRLAGVEEKLGNLVEAAAQLKLALEAKKLSFAQRAKAKNQLKSLEKRIPTISFDLPKGFGGTVKLDDRELSAGELGAPVPANPGKHEVRAEAEGMKPYKESIELAEKDKKHLSVLMTELPSEEPAEAPAEKAEPKKSGGSNTLAYVALGVGVVGVGVGAFMGLQAKSTKSDIDAKCQNGVCGEDQRDLYDKGKTQANISTAGFIVGAVGLGVGTVLLLTGGKGKVEGKTEARRVTPYVGPKHVGVYGQF